MATNYPGSLDSGTQQPSPSSSTEMDDSGFEHDVVHTNHSGAIIALETKVGTGDSNAVASSVLGGTGSGTSAWTTTPTFGGLTVDTNTLHVDATNNRVGIGTTSPSSALEVNDGLATVKNDNGGYSSVSKDEGLALTSNGMNPTSKYTPGVLFGSTDSQFTTTNPKYNAGIFGRSTETYSSDSDTAMNIEFRVSGTNGGTGHGIDLATGFRMTATSFFPLVDNSVDLGLSSGGNRFDDVFATSGTVNTSDERDKTSIADLDLGLAFVNSLRPVSYTWNDRSGYVGTRTHMGFLAQEVATALGDDAANRGLWIHSASEPLDPEDPDGEQSDDRQGLRYHQFMAPMVKAIQELSTRVAALEAA